MLEAVIDPELHSSIVELGMVRDVAVDEDGLVSVEIALTIASCPLRGQIEGDVESRLRGLPGVTGVEIRTGAMTAAERASLMAQVRIWGEGQKSVSLLLARLPLDGSRPQSLESADGTALGTSDFPLLGRSGNETLFLNRYTATILRR